ncbi:helix-turn-helix transcriptional regulator [Paucibacter sp. B51]|uniref:helix-turn-helix transcriptional regulator n=1 Tax=Paucibacter sp. B51 TaxID=2993315 RepID=UPI0022EBE393|nr:AlpA family phage regulatory protein [Paucibacter sp. B51]
MKPTSISPPPEVSNTQITLIRLAGVMRMTGLCRSSIYALIAEKQFPCQVQLSKRAVAWRRTEVEQWSLSRPTVPHAQHDKLAAASRLSDVPEQLKPSATVVGAVTSTSRIPTRGRTDTKHARHHLP